MGPDGEERRSESEMGEVGVKGKGLARFCVASVSLLAHDCR